MNARVIRCVLVVLVLGSVAIRLHSIRDREATVASFDMGAAIKATVTASNLSLVPNPYAPPSTRSRIVYFRRANCVDLSMALPYAINLEIGLLIDRVIGKDAYSRRFFFIERTWTEQSRVAMYVEWLKHAALSTLGLSPYRPVRLAVALADPPGCTAETIDWSRIWLRANAPSAAPVASRTAMLPGA